MATKYRFLDANEEQKQKKRLVDQAWFVSLVSILAALVLFTFIMIVAGYDVLLFWEYFYLGTFGSKKAVGDVIGIMAALTVLGLSMMVSFRAGLFNIGSAGQVLAGGFTSYLVAMNFAAAGLTGFLYITIAILAGVFLAAIIGLFIGLLKTRAGVNEVIASIFINWIIFYVIMAAISAGAITGTLGDNTLRPTWLVSAFDGSQYINLGIIFILLVPIFAFIYKRTQFGYRQTIIGSNATVAQYIGINEKTETTKTMVLSAGLAGLAGAIVYLGFDNPPLTTTAMGVEIAGQAYHGITIALLGGLNAWGVMLAAFFVALFEASASTTATVTNSVPMSTIYLALVLIILATFRVFRYRDPFEDIKAWANTDSIPKSQNSELAEEDTKASNVKKTNTKGGNK